MKASLETQQQVVAALDDWAAAYGRKDADAYAAAFSDDVMCSCLALALTRSSSAAGKSPNCCGGTSSKPINFRSGSEKYASRPPGMWHGQQRPTRLSKQPWPARISLFRCG